MKGNSTLIRRFYKLTLTLALLSYVSGCLPINSDSKNSSTDASEEQTAQGQECNADPAKILKELTSPDSNNQTSDIMYLDKDSLELQNLCKQSPAPSGFNDPICTAYCDNCLSQGLPDDFNKVVSTVAKGLNAIDFVADGADIIGNTALLSSVSSFAKRIVERYPAMEKTAWTIYFLSSTYGLFNTILHLDKKGFGESKTRKYTDLLCYSVAMFRSAEFVPTLGAAAKTVTGPMLKIPAVNALVTSSAITCSVGRFIADSMIRCPSFQRGCKEALVAAQPIDNNSCCICGTKSVGTDQLIQTWGGFVYGGPENCEEQTTDKIRSKLPNAPSTGELSCERIKVDRTRTPSCSFQRFVYGANLTCGRDQGTYCVETPVYTASGSKISGPPTPQRDCSEFTSIQQIENLIDQQLPTTFEVDKKMVQAIIGSE